MELLQPSNIQFEPAMHEYLRLFNVYKTQRETAGVLPLHFHLSRRLGEIPNDAYVFHQDEMEIRGNVSYLEEGALFNLKTLQGDTNFIATSEDKNLSIIPVYYDEDLETFEPVHKNYSLNDQDAVTVATTEARVLALSEIAKLSIIRNINHIVGSNLSQYPLPYTAIIRKYQNFYNQRLRELTKR